MFYKTITGDRLLTVVMIFLFALVIWVPAFISPEIVFENTTKNSMPFYRLIWSLLDGHVLMSKMLSFGIIILEAFMLVRINAKFVLIQQKTFLPALFFIIIVGHSSFLLQWNPLLPASVFVILLLDIVFRSYKDDPNSYRYFEAGIMLGAGSLFYAPLVYLVFFIWLAARVQRPFYWREYVFPFLGLLVPWIFFFAYLFLTDKNIPEFITALKSNFILEFQLPEYPWFILVFAGYLGLLILMASVYLLKVFQFRKIYIRDYFMVLFWLFIVSSLIFFLFSEFNAGITYLVAISMSYMLTNYFINARKSIGNKVLLYLLLGYAVFLAMNNLIGIV